MMMPTKVNADQGGSAGCTAGRRLWMILISPLIVAAVMNVRAVKTEKKTVLAAKNQTTPTTTTSPTETKNNTTTTPTISFERKRGCHQGEEKNNGGACRLQFVHIPKTGGSAIELAAAVKANISWGVCTFCTNFDPGPGILGLDCPESQTASTTVKMPENPSRFERRCHKFPNPSTLLPQQIPNRVSHWHLPPRYFQYLTTQQIYYDNQDNPYNDAALFAVVRNPYERIISEYFMKKEILEHADVTAMNNATTMNRWISRQLVTLLNKTADVDNNNNNPLPATAASRAIFRPNSYYQRDGHFLPQYDYVFDTANGDRVVDHVLHFENLHDEFSQLMKAYNLPIELPAHHEKTQNVQQTATAVVVVGARTATHKQLDRYNLTFDTMRLIEQVYQHDFVAFGYPTLSGDNSR